MSNVRRGVSQSSLPASNTSSALWLRVQYSRPTVPIRLLVHRLALRRRRVAVGIVTAFLFLVGVLTVLFSRVFLQLVVGIVWFVIDGTVDARGVRGCRTFA